MRIPLFCFCLAEPILIFLSRRLALPSTSHATYSHIGSRCSPSLSYHLLFISSIRQRQPDHHSRVPLTRLPRLQNFPCLLEIITVITPCRQILSVPRIPIHYSCELLSATPYVDNTGKLRGREIVSAVVRVNVCRGWRGRKPYEQFRLLGTGVRIFMDFCRKTLVLAVVWLTKR